MIFRVRSSFIIVLNIALVAASLGVAWLLRFEFTLPHKDILLAALPVLVLMRLAALTRFNLLHGYWRYTGINDVADIVKATALGSLGFLVAERWILEVKAFPITIYCIEAMLTTGALCGIRFLSRMLIQAVASHGRKRSHKSVIIVGAGDAGALLLRELPLSGYMAIGLVDDDRSKLGARIDGVPVIGVIDELPKLVKTYNVDEILLAIPSATGRQMRRLTELCERSGSPFRTMPAIADLIDGKVTIDQLRDVKIDDLLGREPIELNLESVREQLAGKVVMVTGAAGSIGSELCAQLTHYQPGKLLCVDKDESGLFFLEQKLTYSAADVQAEYHVADVGDRRRMRGIIATGEVDIIFHAAAYKHVPMMESNVLEAVQNNIFGLMSLLDVAERCGCSSFVMISSDKAVNPTNVMGCTKRICELIMAGKPKSRMRRVSVRFGNVLGSQGSVIPVFQEQIRKRHMVTVTHPDVTRFFMTIPEAVALVLQAFALGNNGEVMVLEMGEPMRIVDLARALIRLCGHSEDDIEIVFTGLRKGEKMHEELFYDSEVQLDTACDKIRRASGKLTSWSLLERHLSELRDLVHAGTDHRIRAKLKDIVPEYTYVEPAEAIVAARATVLQYPSKFRIIPAAAGGND
ncbi:MAG: nucleoside-diphosphate sugar epimerase/dehydratase [Candidatus Korobacteraceae bacterium]